MEKSVKIFLIIALANLTITSSATKHSSYECKTTSSKSPLLRLKKHVLCNIDSDERPSPGGKNATEVSLVLLPKLLNFDERSGNLELHSLLYTDWEDERLKWDPTSFENITEMEVSSWEIWTPEVTHSGIGNNDPKGSVYNFVQCYITARKGRVSCIIETVNNIQCDTDFTEWPYDRQNCTLALASWAHSDEEFKIREKTYDSLIFGVFGQNQEWSLSVGRLIREQRPSMYFKDTNSLVVVIDFILDRTTSCLRAQAVSPAIIMMVMTIITSYLEPLSVERFAVACLGIVVHFLCIMDLNWIIPDNGETVPNILLFYCNSLALATIALLLTFVLGKIERKKTSPPRWVTSCVVRMLKSKIGQIFLLSIFEIGDPRPAAEVEATADDTGALVNSDSSSRKLVWRYVSIFVLRLFYYVFILTYCIMFITLILTSAIRPPLPSVRMGMGM